MKLMFEKILPNENSSWRFWCYQDNEIEFNWHYHPEYEIALTLGSNGQRYVGDSIEDYGELDLALLGPHLPHTWSSAAELNGQLQQVYVAQIPANWIENLVVGMPELDNIKALLVMSKRGIKFSDFTAKKVASHFKKMHKQNASQRFISLMEILQLMVDDPNKNTLSSENYTIALTSDNASDKLDKIIQYIYQRYTDAIKAEDVAKLVHMSTNHFHRFFKQRTEQTFIEVVNQLRISKACSLLINTHMPISTISDLCGFNNISNFNRRFLKLKAMKPSHFRQHYKNIKN
ncbi:AraC family transcriptional regulator [Thalassotalea profundi]|uniref:AraC family transcriptional regulator n=1 Tax=Thalassotalea profundi TaxID=2036687 RepID=A0ABQ3IQU5_9GAMM|nr:AraC family transcriptional regulator [Thalassotalea profundi]GHE89843.1 AraC family transcriptional regulator [Thalassotalea profundi]